MSDVLPILLGVGIISGIYAIAGFLIYRRHIASTLDQVADLFSGILTDPTVSKAFGIIGSQGGQAKADKAIVDNLAADMLSSPQLSAIRMGADALGIDMDSYIEKHGAMGTIQGLTQIAGMLGIDINQLLAGGKLPSLSGGSGDSGNPYL